MDRINRRCEPLLSDTMTPFSDDLIASFETRQMQKMLHKNYGCRLPEILKTMLIRATRQNVIADPTGDDDDNATEMADEINPETHVADQEMVRYLTEDLIPGLPAEQRLAWLLRHESEYWEPGRPLQWQHMADLNGVDVEHIWRTFESAREKFMRHHRPDSMPDIETEELSVFLVWTQAQRASKHESFSWDYFANLLNVPVNTMKTRYRSAQQALANGLEDYRSVSS